MNKEYPYFTLMSSILNVFVFIYVILAQAFNIYIFEIY